MCASFHSPKKNISQECAFLYLKLIPTESLKLLMLFETFKYDLMIIRNMLKHRNIMHAINECFMCILINV